MNFRDRNKYIVLLGTTITLFFFVYVGVKGTYWNSLDYKLTDLFYKISWSPGSSFSKNKILYLTVTDRTYRNTFRESKFQRDVFADIMEKVISLGPEAILVDLVFAYPSEPTSDSALKSVFNNKDLIYLPLALTNNLPENGYNNDLIPKSGLAIKKSENPEEYILKTYIPDIFTGDGNFKNGHINVFPDQDGIYRHSSIMIGLDSFYVPSLPLRAYLDYCGVPVHDIRVEWGSNVTIPAGPDTWIKEDIVIPLNNNGRMYIPYKDIWGKDFMHMSVDHFNDLYKDPVKRSILTDLISGRFIIAGDISTGISDLASTPLDQNIPLIALFASELNAYLTKNFYKEVDNNIIAVIIFLIFFLLTASALKHSKIFYYSGISILSILLLIGILLVNFNYFLPISSLLIYTILLFSVLFTYVGFIDFRENKTLHENMLIKNYELEEARQLQLSLLPKKLPISECFDISAVLRSATEVGGDFYDIKNENGRITIMLCDVVGHGLKAGMMSLVLKTLFLSVENDHDLLSVLSKIHNGIKKLKSRRFYAGIILVNIMNKKVSFISAGMPPVLYFNNLKNEVEEIQSESLPAGSFGFNYKTIELNVNEEDILLFYSDGLIELLNDQGEMFGAERIKNILLNMNGTSLNDISCRIEDLLNKWISGNQPYDDVSFILVRIKNTEATK